MIKFDYSNIFLMGRNHQLDKQSLQSSIESHRIHLNQIKLCMSECTHAFWWSQSQELRTSMTFPVTKSSSVWYSTRRCRNSFNPESLLIQHAFLSCMVFSSFQPRFDLPGRSSKSSFHSENVWLRAEGSQNMVPWQDILKLVLAEHPSVRSYNACIHRACEKGSLVEKEVEVFQTQRLAWYKHSKISDHIPFNNRGHPDLIVDDDTGGVVSVVAAAVVAVGAAPAAVAVVVLWHFCTAQLLQKTSGYSNCFGWGWCLCHSVLSFLRLAMASGTASLPPHAHLLPLTGHR